MATILFTHAGLCGLPFDYTAIYARLMVIYLARHFKTMPSLLSFWIICMVLWWFCLVYLTLFKCCCWLPTLLLPPLSSALGMWWPRFISRSHSTLIDWLHFCFVSMLPLALVFISPRAGLLHCIFWFLHCSCGSVCCCVLDSSTQFNVCICCVFQFPHPRFLLYFPFNLCSHIFPRWHALVILVFNHTDCLHFSFIRSCKLLAAPHLYYVLFLP